MPLPTNYSRPSLPYATLQSLPNDRRFVNLTTLQQPPTAEMFDAELNAILDKINTLAAAINATVAGNIPGSDDPQNAGKFLVTDGAGNLSFVLAGSNNIALNAIATALLQNQAVTQEKIGDGAVGTPQLADSAVTFVKIADGAIGNAKIANGSVQLPKMRSSGHSCFVIGDDADYAYKELLVAPNWNIATRIPNDTKPSMQPFLNFWNAQGDGTLTGSKITDNSVPFGKLRSAGYSSFLVGNNADYKYNNLLVTTAWQVPTLKAGDNTPSMTTLDQIWGNNPNSFNGAMLTPNSIPVTRIQNAGQVAPFAMGYSGGGTLVNARIDRMSRGVYRISFQTPCKDANYSVLSCSEYQTVMVTVYSPSRTTNNFLFYCTDVNNSFYDTLFSFVVYSP